MNAVHEAYRIVYEGVPEARTHTVEDFQRILEHGGWQMRPIVSNDKVIGGFMVLGHEVHFGVNAAVRKELATARAVSVSVEELIGELGWVETRIYKDDAASIGMYALRGFRETGRDKEFVYLKCEALSCHKPYLT